METIIFTLLYIVAIISIFSIFINQYKKSIALEKLVEKIYMKWIEKLNLSFWQGKLIFIAILLFLFLIIHWFIYNSDKNYGHAYIITFFLSISYSPSWVIKIGRNGIILKNDLIRWEYLQFWDLNKHKNYNILYLKSYDSEFTIKIPPRYASEINDILLKLLPDKRYVANKN